MRSEAAGELESQILLWAKRNNARNNLRTLIATLSDILGKEIEWNAVNLSELLSDDQVKVFFYGGIILNFISLL